MSIHVCTCRYKIKTFLNRATPSDSMSYSLKTSVFDVIPNGRSSIPWAAFSYCWAPSDLTSCKKKDYNNMADSFSIVQTEGRSQFCLLNQTWLYTMKYN